MNQEDKQEYILLFSKHTNMEQWGDCTMLLLKELGKCPFVV